MWCDGLTSVSRPLRLVDLPVGLGPSQPKADRGGLPVTCDLTAQASRPVFLLRLPAAAQDSQGSRHVTVGCLVRRKETHPGDHGFKLLRSDIDFCFDVWYLDIVVHLISGTYGNYWCIDHDKCNNLEVFSHKNSRWESSPTSQ